MQSFICYLFNCTSLHLLGLLWTIRSHRIMNFIVLCSLCLQLGKLRSCNIAALTILLRNSRLIFNLQLYSSNLYKQWPQKGLVQPTLQSRTTSAAVCFVNHPFQFWNLRWCNAPYARTFCMTQLHGLLHLAIVTFLSKACAYLKDWIKLLIGT